MTKEMLFLADIYTNWCKSQGLPDFMSADDLRYGRDTTDKLNFYQMNWLECFIDVWDCINQNTQENKMNISDLLCDLYDIREMGRLCGFGKLPKDNDGTSFTIDEVLENAITELEG